MALAQWWLPQPSILVSLAQGVLRGRKSEVGTACSNAVRADLCGGGRELFR